MDMIDPSLLLKVLPIIVLINGCLFGLYKILEAVSKYTSTDADDKAANIMGKVIGGIQKLIDVVMGNPEHKK